MMIWNLVVLEGCWADGWYGTPWIQETVSEDRPRAGWQSDVSDTDMGISNVPQHTSY